MLKTRNSHYFSKIKWSKVSVNCIAGGYPCFHSKTKSTTHLVEDFTLPERLELKCCQLKIISLSAPEIICNETLWSHPQHISRVAVQSEGVSVEGFELLHFIITSAVFTSTTQRSRVLPTIHDARARFPSERGKPGADVSVELSYVLHDNI